MIDTAELSYLQDLRNKIDRLREHLNSQAVPENTASTSDWYVYLNMMKEIQGNASNSVSFVACLMAKEYLDAHLPMQTWSAASKPQGASGLDIDEYTVDKRRVIGEVKTTSPHLPIDLGAAQKKSFRADFLKLNSTNADFKFFFVTENATFQVMQHKYAQLIPTVKIILLTTGEDYCVSAIL